MWKLAGHGVSFETPELRGQIDLTQPAAGVTNLALLRHGRTSDLPGTNILGVQFPAAQPREAVCESWVRGDDVVAVYGETSERLYRPEIYWRLLPPDATRWAGLELIVSVQTSRLDAHPLTSAASRLEAVELLRLADGLFLFRPAGAPFSYAEMVGPGDLLSATLLCRERTTELQWRFVFGDYLEKGVIRRVRLRGVIMPREEDTTLARQQFENFAATPPPLTT